LVTHADPSPQATETKTLDCVRKGLSLVAPSPELRDRRSSAAGRFPAKPPVSAARTRIVLLVLLAGVAPTAAAASSQVSQPTITLLSPGNGTVVEGSQGRTGVVTFRWQTAWAQPTSGTVTVTLRVATDPSLTQSVTTTSRSCPAEKVSCWTTVRPNRFYEGGRQYWQVSITGAATATSRTWMFLALPARPTPDRLRPRVQAYRGAARRGRKALFVARVADDHGEARMQVDLAYRNQLAFRTMTLLKPVRWGVRQQFDSRRPLPRSLPPGPYRLCVTAWDRTGNRAKSCARYFVR
jgi:hypothetical protein